MIEVLLQAMKTQHGLKIKAKPFKLVRARLYKARRDHGWADLNQLSFVQSPDAEDEIWIIKRTQAQSEVA